MKGKHRSKEEYDEAVAYYLEDLRSIKEVAERFGMDPNNLSLELEKRGVKRPYRSIMDVDEVIDYYLDSESTTLTAKKFNVSIQVIYRILKENGIVRKSIYVKERRIKKIKEGLANGKSIKQMARELEVKPAYVSLLVREIKLTGDIVDNRRRKI